MKITLIGAAGGEVIGSCYSVPKLPQSKFPLQARSLAVLRAEVPSVPITT